MDTAKRALYGVDEALAEVSKLRALIERRTGLVYVKGKPTATATSFGRIKATGTAVAIVLSNGSSGSIAFNGTTVASGASPFIFQIPEGEGELTFSTVSSTACALLFGGIKIIQAAE